MNIVPAPTDPSPPPANDSFDGLLHSVGENKDRAAFIQIFNHFAPRIKSFLMKAGVTAEHAEELAQETMVTVWTRAKLYDPQKANAGTWIFTIARNKRIDALRKGGRAQFDSNDPSYVPDTTSQTADNIVLDSERMARIAQTIKTLPAEQSDLIRKAFFEDKTHIQIAQEDNIPLGTVKSRIRLALERLRRQLDREAL